MASNEAHLKLVSMLLRHDAQTEPARAEDVDPLAWIDALPVPSVRPPEHPGEHASTWRLLLHAWRLWRWKRSERSTIAGVAS